MRNSSIILQKKKIYLYNSGNRRISGNKVKSKKKITKYFLF